MSCAVAVLLLTLSAGCARQLHPLILADDERGQPGLLAELVPRSRQRRACAWRCCAPGSGRARDLEAGQADVAISHAPARSLRHPLAGVLRKIAPNDSSSPGRPAIRASARVSDDEVLEAGTTGSCSLARRLVARERVRQSKGGGRRCVDGEDRGRRTGHGHDTAIASEMRGYVLTDRATFMQVKPTLALEIVFEGGPDLLNTYAVVVPDRHVREGSSAMRFGRWLAEGRGRDIIAAFKVTGGIQAFAVWPPDSPRDRPDARPR